MPGQGIYLVYAKRAAKKGQKGSYKRATAKRTFSGNGEGEKEARGAAAAAAASVCV